MKHMVISLVIFSILISLISALEFDFTFDQNKGIREEIQVNLFYSTENETNYDIKIYIHNSSDDRIERFEIISETLNNEEWKDSWNYIDEAFPNSRAFKLKATSYAENTQICFKLRKTNSSKISELCKNILLSKVGLVKDQDGLVHEGIFSTKENRFRTALLFSFLILLVLIIIFITLTNV